MNYLFILPNMKCALHNINSLQSYGPKRPEHRVPEAENLISKLLEELDIFFEIKNRLGLSNVGCCKPLSTV